MSSLEVIKKEDNDFIVKVLGKQDPVRIKNTFSEMFPIVETSPENPT